MGKTCIRKLTEIAEVERAQSGKWYPAGTILITLSGSNDEIGFLRQPCELDNRYAAVIPQGIHPFYLRGVMEMQFPAYFQRVNQGINFSIKDVERMPIKIHESKREQHIIGNCFRELDEKIDNEKEILERTSLIKKFCLDGMFAKGEG